MYYTYFAGVTVETTDIPESDEKSVVFLHKRNILLSEKNLQRDRNETAFWEKKKLEF